MLTKLVRQIGCFLNEDAGNSATEYAVMLSLIIIVSLGAITALSSKMVAIFQFIPQIG